MFGWVLAAPACKTPHPKLEVIEAVDPNAPILADDGRPVAPGAAAALSGSGERLEPVRGGQRVLPPYRGPDPCRMALLGESPVAKACSAAGLRGANELMQTFVRRAKSHGFAFTCFDCHADEDDYTKLMPHADEEFRKLLFLARPED